MSSITSTEKEKAVEIIKLSQNENPFGASPKALKAIEDFYRSVFRYPDVFYNELKQKLSIKHNVSPENIIMSAGSVALMDMSIKSFVEFDQNVITSEKTFVAYELLAKINRRECRCAELVENTISLNSFLSLCDDKTRLMFIANPNNPTGTIIDHDDFKEFLDKVPSNVMVVSDEAYSEYVTDPTYPDSLQLQKTYKNLIIFHTFSKIYGLAGLRIGYAIAAPDVAQQLELCRTPFSVNSLASAAASAALDDTEYIQECISINEKERAFLYNELVNLGFKVTPSQGNFILVEFDKPDERDKIYTLLEGEGILVRKLEPFGIDLGLRISVGRPKDNQHLVKILKLIKKIL
jgi:histidinol-phosphate aminotransferase